MCKSNQEYCKNFVNPEKIDNTINIFKSQEFRVISITKTVENLLKESKEFEPLYKTNFEKPFDIDILSKLSNIKSHCSSKPKDFNPKLSISFKSQKVSNSFIHKCHSSFKLSKYSNNSKSSEKLLLEK